MGTDTSKYFIERRETVKGLIRASRSLDKTRDSKQQDWPVNLFEYYVSRASIGHLRYNNGTLQTQYFAEHTVLQFNIYKGDTNKITECKAIGGARLSHDE